MLGINVTKNIEEALLGACKRYFQENLPDRTFPEDVNAFLQITRDSKHGDLTSNIAMRLAADACRSPKEIGEGIVSLFAGQLENAGLSEFIGSVELKGGFINIKLSEKFFHSVLLNIHKQKNSYGSSSEGKGVSINLEFISANPTGPLTIAHGRQAAIGDALSRILRFNGYNVTNEYYLNDVGRQIKLLGESVEIRYRNLFGEDISMPEDGYMGDYIKKIAEEIREKKKDSLLKKTEVATKFFKDHAVDHMMRMINTDLADFGVNFDVWTSQGDIEGRDEVGKTMDILEEKGHIYEEDGAKWFASTAFGDDKDRVVLKSDGSYTYLAPDIAYHNDKYRRGFDRLIDLLGPDHHGYIRRMKAAVQAMGHDAASLNILIVQLVSLMRGGQVVSMSTRKGEFLSLREIMDEIGTDVTRFFFLSRRLDSHLDFDIELAKKESQENPVYYIQYAHARICSIKKFSKKNKGKLVLKKPQLELLKAKQEKELMRKLGEFPSVVRASAEALEPNKLVVYLNELARAFHSFYTECRVVSDGAELSKARLFVVECVRIVLANGLGLLNITLPETM